MVVTLPHCSLHFPQPMVRKQHNSGFKHKANVKAYYALFEGAMQQIQIEEQIRARMVRVWACQAGLCGVPARGKHGC